MSRRPETFSSVLDEKETRPFASGLCPVRLAVDDERVARGEPLSAVGKLDLKLSGDDVPCVRFPAQLSIDKTSGELDEAQATPVALRRFEAHPFGGLRPRKSFEVYSCVSH